MTAIHRVSVVNVLADALRLDVSEREHLRYLAKITGGACVGSRAQPRLEVRQTVLKLLHQFEPGIALIANRLGDVLALTSGFDLIARAPRCRQTKPHPVRLHP